MISVNWKDRYSFTGLLDKHKDALPIMADKFVENYAKRRKSGVGPDGSRLEENPQWIRDLKGHDTPLYNKGGMAKSLAHNVTDNVVIISFTGKYRTVAAQHQSGELLYHSVIKDYDNIDDETIYTKYPWLKRHKYGSTLRFKTFKLTKREHWGFADEDITTAKVVLRDLIRGNAKHAKSANNSI